MNLLEPPVEILIKSFGGVRKLAKSLNRDPAAVSRWRKSGRVPSAIQRDALTIAWKEGHAITAHELIFGRDHGNQTAFSTDGFESEQKDSLGEAGQSQEALS